MGIGGQVTLMAIVNFYAATRAATGINMKVIAGNTLGDVIANAIVEFPQLASIIPRCSYLVNENTSIDLAKVITDHDVIDVLPQFAGGA